MWTFYCMLKEHRMQSTLLEWRLRRRRRKVIKIKEAFCETRWVTSSFVPNDWTQGSKNPKQLQK